MRTRLEDISKEKDLLADQYKREYTLRKKYKNELEDAKGSLF